MVITSRQLFSSYFSLRSLVSASVLCFVL
uniref:Uncharacterized protein n=1 Tax=Arundo donax TaxID=35708 RepID=A0A0A9GXW1_ARUDO